MSLNYNTLLKILGSNLKDFSKITNNLKQVETVFITSSLALGGSEKTLFNLCKNLKNKKIFIINLSTKQFFSEKIEKEGISLYNCKINKLNFIIKFIKIIYLIVQLKPKVIQTWMYHADLLSIFLKIIFPFTKIFWGVRNGSKELKTSTKLIISFLAIFSYIVPFKIISCSNSATRMHKDIGYKSSKLITINNGVDIEIFKNQSKLRTLFRKQYAIDKSSILFSMVARWSPQKDHLTVLKAFNILSNDIKTTCYLFMAGTNIDEKNNSLLNEINNIKSKKNIYLLGEIDKIETLYNSADINILCAKRGEGFPNILCEAMACGTPCIATNSGDALQIVGDFGFIIQENTVSQLVDAMRRSISEMSNQDDWNRKKINSIDHIKKQYSMEEMVDKYSKIWGI